MVDCQPDSRFYFCANIYGREGKEREGIGEERRGYTDPHVSETVAQRFRFSPS